MIIIQAISEPAKRETRRQALRLMDQHGAGAILIDGRWVWAQDIRSDPKIASAVLAHYAKKEGRG